MATANHDGPNPDLHQLLGVSRKASQEETRQLQAELARLRELTGTREAGPRRE